MNPDPLLIFECAVCGRGMISQPEIFDFRTGLSYCKEHNPQRPPMLIDLTLQKPDGGQDR